MLWNLFNFFADAATGNGTTTDASQNGWVTWVIFGGIAIFMIVMMSLNQRKNKKAQAEMQSKIRVGATIMTIGGIVGEIIQMDAEHFWLATGLGEDKIVLQFSQKAIYTVVTASSTPVPAAEPTDDGVDEIK